MKSFKRQAICLGLGCLLLLVAGCNNADVDAEQGYELAGSDWVDGQTEQLTASSNQLEDRIANLEAEIQQLLGQELKKKTPIFSDVTMEKLDWAYHQINYLIEKNIIKGYQDEGLFYPNQSVTRYQAAAMLIKTFNLPYANWSPVFTDIPEGHWAADVAVTAYQHGIFNGSNGKFKPTDTLTRAQMAQVLINTFQLEEILGKEFTNFSDVSQTFWAYDAIKVVNQHGIAKGSNGSFRPDDRTTRAQFSVFLTNALQK